MALRTIERFFSGWRFPAFAIALLLFTSAWSGVLLAIPAAPTGLGAFAEAFRAWCLAPGDGGGSSVMAFAIFFELLSLAALIGFVWNQPLRRQLRQSAGAMAPTVGTAALVALAMAGSLALVRSPAPTRPEFPERELRTALPAPKLRLTNQDGAPVSLSELKGKVVVATAVYARCGLACPRILGQAKRVVAGLSDAQRQDVRVLGITLDPEHDDVAALGALAEAQSVRAPLYQLLTGGEAEVNAALDGFGVERRRVPKTGVIDHSNLFVLIDREGKVAYRFTLDALQEEWMAAGLRALLRDDVPAPGS